MDHKKCITSTYMLVDGWSKLEKIIQNEFPFWPLWKNLPRLKRHAINEIFDKNRRKGGKDIFRFSNKLVSSGYKLVTHHCTHFSNDYFMYTRTNISQLRVYHPWKRVYEWSSIFIWTEVGHCSVQQIYFRNKLFGFII